MLKFFLTTLLFLSSPLFACHVIDDLGRQIDIKKPARRIISLTPALTENLFAIGAGSEIVGVIKDSDYPSQASTLPIVGAVNALDREQIQWLKPDLIVTWGRVFDRGLSHLAEKGVPIYATDTKRLEGVAKTIRDLGCLTGRVEKANQVADQYLKDLQQLKQRAHGQAIQTIFYQLEPHILMTINHDTWINQAIEYCGGRNLFANLPIQAPVITLEAVLLANPDVIVVGGEDVYFQKWPAMTAVKRQHVYKINPDLISRPSVRLLDGVRQLCSLIDQSRSPLSARS